MFDELMKAIRDLEVEVGKLELAASDVQTATDVVRRTALHPSPSVSSVSPGLTPHPDDAVIEAELLD
jgi:hypothetical protein